MNQDFTPEEVAKLKTAIDNNQQDSPTLSIDPKTAKPSVVGDPNNLHPTKGEYTITYEYDLDEVAEADKPMLELKTFEGVDGTTYQKYIAKVTYTNRRVKPIYRTKVVSLLLDILADLEVVNDKGYTSDLITAASGRVFVNHTEELIQIAMMVLDEKRERLEHAQELIQFMSDLIENEPNIVNEVMGFLGSLSNGQSNPVQTVQTLKQSSTQG